MAELVVLFLKYPQWVGEKAIVEAKRASPQFVPSVPLVEKAAEEAFGQIRQATTYGDNWDERSRRQLQERAVIEQANKEEDPEQRRVVLARLWPSALDEPRSTMSEIGNIPNPPKEGFRQFSADDLKKIYPPKAAP